MEHIIEAVTAGVDWITLTLDREAPYAQTWLEGNLRCLDGIETEGYKLEFRKLLGYEGVSCGGSFVGEREDGFMVQFSGRHAHKYVHRALRADAHVSRLDLQVTVKYEVMPKGIAKGAYREAMHENKTLPKSRQRKIYIIVGSDNGDTLYIGSPTSDQRGRLYNKEVQSEDPDYSRTWRFEAVYKNDIATRLGGDIAAHMSDLERFCSNQVAFWYETRGVTVPWEVSTDFVPLPPIKTLPTDIERKLNWLRHQVKPTIKYLIEQGFYDTIKSALELPSD